MTKLVLLMSLVSSTAFATVRYPISVAISPDGKTTVARGTDRNAMVNAIEASGRFAMSIKGGE